MLLRSSMAEVSKLIYPVAVRELSGQLFLMAAQYLCHEGNLVKSAVTRWARPENPFMVVVILTCFLYLNYITCT